jgi:uncharacterized protein YkwD
MSPTRRVTILLVGLLALVAVGACGENGVVPGTGSPGPTGTAPAPDAAAIEDRIAGDLFDRLNDERAARGLGRLAWDDELAELAKEWSFELAPTDTLEHRDLGPVLREGRIGGMTALGENLFRANGPVPAGAAHLGWMNSDGHRANLLQPGWDRVGVGVVCREDGSVVATQNFGRTAGSDRPELADETPPREPVARPQDDGPACQ